MQLSVDVSIVVLSDFYLIFEILYMLSSFCVRNPSQINQYFIYIT